MAGKTSILLQRRWNRLLSWLVEDHGFQAQNIAVECREMTHAGNGLFARNACMPGSLLFMIPPKALMNKATLKRLYPHNARVEALSAVQLISMHLFIWRPKAGEDSVDPSFGPYISILPRNFSSHPLTWLVLSRFGKADLLWTSLLDGLPPSVLAALHRLHTRFRDDWTIVRTFLQSTPSIAPPNPSLEADAIMYFLWAWLNVNTRCIYYRLKHEITDPDNLTMCPILDFANHTPGQAHMIPVPSSVEAWSAAPVDSVGNGIKIITPQNARIEENDELLLVYGLHSNRTLFVEYGFVNMFSKNGPSPSGEVDVQDLVEKHIFVDVRLCEAVRVALVNEGYWGDWTLYSTRDGAQPSWRLITALRLYFLVVTAGSANERSIQLWRDVVTGNSYQVSCENEKSWKEAVVLLCDMVIDRAEKATASDFTLVENGEDTWNQWMAENIRTLWKEELLVARAVKECVLRGDEF